MVLEHKIAIENSAKLRIYNRLLADKVTIYEQFNGGNSESKSELSKHGHRRVSSANPRLGRDRSHAETERKAPPVEIKVQDTTEMTVVSSQIMENPDSSINTQAEAVKVFIKQDPEMTKVIKEVDQVFEDPENLAAIM
jgi:hypothetical protein